MSKKTFNKPKRVQLFYLLLFFTTGGTLFYLKTLPKENQHLGVLLALFIIMMFALIKSTRNWAYDNPKNTEDEKTATDKPVYKDKNIPTLEEMMQNIQKKKQENT